MRGGGGGGTGDSIAWCGAHVALMMLLYFYDSFEVSSQLIDQD